MDKRGIRALGNLGQQAPHRVERNLGAVLALVDVGVQRSKESGLEQAELRGLWLPAGWENGLRLATPWK